MISEYPAASVLVDKDLLIVAIEWDVALIYDYFVVFAHASVICFFFDAKVRRRGELTKYFVNRLSTKIKFN